MPPNQNQKPRPSIDSVRRAPASGTPSKRKPDYRPDHELPAPEPTPLLEAEAHEDATAAKPQPTVPEVTNDDKPNLVVQKPSSKKKWVIRGLIGLAVAIVVAIIGVVVWYQGQLAPVSSDKSKQVRVSIQPGTGPSAIAKQLKAAGIIRSDWAFGIHTKLSGTENTLKAGIYNLQPSLSTPEIVNELVKGAKDNTFRVTFLPGDTLANGRKKLIELGLFSTADIDAALNKQYDRPLFATKPASADLEGYLYGETLEFDSSATVETILDRFFDLFEAVIKENDLVAAYQKQGLTLYEGITLASIVQRETSVGENQRQVARVFLNRMDEGMTLGSDVTYQYAAKKMGIAPHPGIDSPYNTRIHAGLPPGPIAAPGKTSLLAVANPGTNDYVFFLSGDDGKMYYAKTDAEHQRNITNHCKEKCLIL